MSDVESSAGKLIEDSRRLERLLALEKQRRGLPTNDLVFVGMHNVAQHWWCTQQAVLKSRAAETDFFGSYLYDRIVYAHRLGLVKKLPRRDDAVLDIGREITLADVENLCKSDEQETSDQSKRQAGAQGAPPFILEIEDDDGKVTYVLDPNLPEAKKRSYEKRAEAGDFRVARFEEFPLEPMFRGSLLQSRFSEKYATLRWSFPWREKYIVVGMPDGLTDEFVYEYKTTQNRYFLTFNKPVALAQADLYGCFFNRPRKRVQIRVVDEGVTETYEGPIDAAKAEETLAAFARVDRGEAARPPKPWKCRNCDFRVTCPISQAAAGTD